MRNALLKSSALTALLIATSFAYAQAPEPNRNEPKNEKTEKSAPPKQQNERGAQSEQKGSAEQSQPRKPETNRAGSDRPANRSAAEESKKPESTGQASQPAKAEQKSEQKADQDNARRKNAEERRQSEPKGAAPRNKAEGAKEPDKSKSESKSTAVPAPQQEQKKGAATQAPQNQQPAAAQSTAPSTNSAAGGTPQQPSSSTATNNNAQRGATTATNTNQLAPQKKVQISETLNRTRVAPPERNLNVTINVGIVVPPRVRFHPLPREIWSIEPRYRDYDYFTTEEDIVIIEPRTRRVVDLIPRNPSRARAQVTTTTTSSGAMAQGGGSPCQVMRRDPASGQLTEVRPDQSSTVGSGGGSAPLSVTVQTGGNQMSQPVALDARAGQIVVATQGNGDCQITIEPQPR